MPDLHVISALEDKAHDLRSAIVSYEEHLERTRQELAVETATIAIMARDGHSLTGNRPAHVRNLFGRSEPLALCKTALAGDCKLRQGRQPNIYDRCGAYFPDVGGTRPPDEPAAAPKQKLRVVR